MERDLRRYRPPEPHSQVVRTLTAGGHTCLFCLRPITGIAAKGHDDDGNAYYAHAHCIRLGQEIVPVNEGPVTPLIMDAADKLHNPRATLANVLPMIYGLIVIVCVLCVGRDWWHVVEGAAKIAGGALK